MQASVRLSVASMIWKSVTRTVDVMRPRQAVCSRPVKVKRVRTFRLMNVFVSVERGLPPDVIVHSNLNGCAAVQCTSHVSSHNPCELHACSCLA